MVGLTQGSSTMVDINIPPSTLGLLVNATPKSEQEGIVTSEFNLTSPGSVPLVLRITPSKPSRVIAFVRRDEVPTTTEYDWLLTSWADTDNYTLYITADLTKDATHIYVGVQSSEGMSHILSSDAATTLCVSVVRAALCDNAKAGLIFCCCFFLSFLFFFYSARDLRDFSADRRESLPHDRKWVQF